MTDGIRPDGCAGNGIVIVVIVIRYGIHIQQVVERFAVQLGRHTVAVHYAAPERIVHRNVIVRQIQTGLRAVVLHAGDLAVGSSHAHADPVRAAEHTAVRYCADVGTRAGGQTGDRDKLHGLFGDIGSLAVLDGDGLDGNGAVCVAVRPDSQRCAFKGFAVFPSVVYRTIQPSPAETLSSAGDVAAYSSYVRASAAFRAGAEGDCSLS